MARFAVDGVKKARIKKRTYRTTKNKLSTKRKKLKRLRSNDISNDDDNAIKVKPVQDAKKDNNDDNFSLCNNEKIRTINKESNQFSNVNGSNFNSASEEKTLKKFSSLKRNVSNETIKAIREMGFETMTDIQAKTIPILLKGLELRGTAKTGSGKTLAFLVPVVELIVKQKFKPCHGTRAIIVSPTRELSMQIFNVLKSLMKYHSQPTFGLIIGGTDRKKETELLKRGLNIVIATPGRLLDHLQNTSVFFSKALSCLVLDEADRILDIGFEEELRQILKLLKYRRQTILFSATKSSKTNELTRIALKPNFVEVDVDSEKIEATSEGLSQTYIICPIEKKFLVLCNFLKRCMKKKVMVFFNSCLTVKFYHQILEKIGITTSCIHGRKDQEKRTSTFCKFSNTSTGILLCTDIVARGLDFPAVDWIVQYDPPDDPKNYIHRVGRTARAGGVGEALLFLSENEVGFIDYLKSCKVTVDEMKIEWSKVANIQSQLKKYVESDKLLSASARKAFLSYVKAYESYSLKDIFNVTKLDLDKVAKLFLLQKTPNVIINKGFSKDREKKNTNFNSKKKYFKNKNFKSKFRNSL